MSRTVPDIGDDELLARFGYTQRFVRSLRGFDSFAVGFSFISVTTGIFTTFGFLLREAGPRGIWTWPLVVVGQTLVAMVFAALAAKMPLAGYSYQWASRLASPLLGWWFGWLAFAFLVVNAAAVDYALVSQAFLPMMGIAATPLATALWTAITLALQAALIIWSTRATLRVNNSAMIVEVIGLLELSIILLAAGVIARQGSWSNLTSTGVVSESGWYGWLGPFMLATLMGAFTAVGFEAPANLAEETHEPRRTLPKATIRSAVLSGILGMGFLVVLAVAIDDVEAASGAAAPVAFILADVLGSGIEKIFLLFVSIAIFACGTVILLTGSRLVWAMARDRRLPGHQLLAQVQRPTSGPIWATVLVALLAAVIVLLERNSPTALVTLFAAATLLPVVIYAGTVLLYMAVGQKLAPEPGVFQLGRMEWPVVLGGLVWLAFELLVLLGASDFRRAQLYLAGAVLLGLLVFGVTFLLEPDAMRRQPGLPLHGFDQRERRVPAGLSRR